MRVSPFVAAASKIVLWYSNDQSEVMTSTLMDKLPPLSLDRRRIYLLRHGQTDWNTRGLMQGGGFDIQLNDIGRQQAELVAEQLSDVPLGVVASSHLKRAFETAEKIHTYHPRAERTVLDNFGEMRFGEFEGMAIRGPESTESSRERVKLARTNMMHDKSFVWPGGGESVSQVEARATAGLHEILEKYPNANHIAIVAHGRTNRVLLSSLLGCNVHELQQGNTCINVIDVNRQDKRSWKPVVLNYVDHVSSDLTIRPTVPWGETKLKKKC